MFQLALNGSQTHVFLNPPTGWQSSIWQLTTWVHSNCLTFCNWPPNDIMCIDRLLDRLIFATVPFKFIHKKSFPKSVFAEFRQVVDTRFKETLLWIAGGLENWLIEKGQKGQCNASLKREGPNFISQSPEPWRWKKKPLTNSLSCCSTPRQRSSAALASALYSSGPATGSFNSSGR